VHIGYLIKEQSGTSLNKAKVANPERVTQEASLCITSLGLKHVRGSCLVQDKSLICLWPSTPAQVNLLLEACSIGAPGCRLLLDHWVACTSSTISSLLSQSHLACLGQQSFPTLHGLECLSDAMYLSERVELRVALCTLFQRCSTMVVTGHKGLVDNSGCTATTTSRVDAIMPDKAKLCRIMHSYNTVRCAPVSWSVFGGLQCTPVHYCEKWWVALARLETCN
jgi:hypothetical protein